MFYLLSGGARCEVYLPLIWAFLLVLHISLQQFGMEFESGFARVCLCGSNYISKGGRVTLIRNTISSLPIYFMSLFCVPMVVRLRLEQIQRYFLWGGGALEHKPHLVKWPIVCRHKKREGLGVKNLLVLIRLSFVSGVDVL